MLYGHYMGESAGLQLTNMDPAFDKRMMLRQSIRRKEIEQIKKSKRQMFEKQIKRTLEEQQQEKLYQRVIHNSHEVFSQGQRYLQLLRQALSWHRVCKYKIALPEVVLNLIKFYEDNSLSSSVMVLLIQCLAMIFCQTAIQFDELTKKCLSICVDYFNSNKVGEGDEKLMRNRCLVAICNITATYNSQILRFCVEICLLQNLQNFLEDFPVEDENKINILSIYGNIINYHLNHCYHQHNHPLSYFPFLLKQCIEQNYNSDVLIKATEAVTNLLKIQNLDKLDILSNVDCLFFNILSVKCYIEGIQDLLDVILQYFATGFDIEIENFDINTLFPKLFSILELLQSKLPQKVHDHAAVARSCFWMAIISHKYFEYTEEQKLEQLTKNLCNYWTDLEDDTPFEFQLYFLRFLRFSLSNLNVLGCIYEEWSREIEQKNAIGAPTWQIIIEFLKSCQIEDPSVIEEFLTIFNIENLIEMIPVEYRDTLYQKIEGCYYSQINNFQISHLADEVLKKYQIQNK